MSAYTFGNHKDAKSKWKSSQSILIAGGAGKFVYALACFSLFSSGVGKPFLVVTGVIDMLFASLFALAVFSNRKQAEIL